MMKKMFLATLTALFILGSLPGLAAQRYVERHSTDPGKDLDRVSFSGKITSIRGQEARVTTDDGVEINVHLGPRWYWHERGYNLRSGMHVEISGWTDRGRDDYCFAGSISGPGFYFELSDSHGYPRWADPGDWRQNWRPRRHHYEIHYYHPQRYTPRWWSGPPRHHYRQHPPWNHRPPRYDHPPRRHHGGGCGY